MATRIPLSWLGITNMPVHDGREIALLARATYDEQVDMLVLTGPGGQRDATQVGRHSMQPLVKLMLRGMFRREQEQGGRGK